MNVPTSTSARFYGDQLKPVREFAKELMSTRREHGAALRLSAKQRKRLRAHVEAINNLKGDGALDFSRAQLDYVVAAYNAGNQIEFETLGPYLATYYRHGGVMRLDNLIKEDAIGLRLGALLRQWFPNGRLVSLYDEYNRSGPGVSPEQQEVKFSPDIIARFRKSLIDTLTEAGAIPRIAIEKKDYWLLSESNLIAAAQRFVAQLDEKGFIRRNGREILFINEHAENPLHMEITLRAKSGKWLCQALDAAGYLNAANLSITHLIVLPEYMREEQDQVWEMLTILGMKPEQYHNVFFNPTYSPEVLVDAFTRALQSATRSYSSR